MNLEKKEVIMYAPHCRMQLSTHFLIEVRSTLIIILWRLKVIHCSPSVPKFNPTKCRIKVIFFKIVEARRSTTIKGMRNWQYFKTCNTINNIFNIFGTSDCNWIIITKKTHVNQRRFNTKVVFNLLPKNSCLFICLYVFFI